MALKFDSHVPKPFTNSNPRDLSYGNPFAELSILEIELLLFNWPTMLSNSLSPFSKSKPQFHE